MTLLSTEGTRYANTTVKDFYLNIWEPTEISPSFSDKVIILEAKYHERPDLLSFDEYGTPSYWWVFMQVNKDIIFDPIYDFKSGIEIVVPPISSIVGN